MDLSNKTIELLNEFTRATIARENYRREESKINSQLQNAINAVGEYIIPKELTPKVGEKFQVWLGDGLLEVEKTNSTYIIAWRKLPSAASKLETCII